MQTIQDQAKKAHEKHVNPNAPKPISEGGREDLPERKVEKKQESLQNTSSYSGVCAQNGSFQYTFTGNPQPLPSDQRYNGEIPLKELKDAADSRILPNNNWIRTADEILNPAIRAGYYHSSFIITSTYEADGSINHRQLGAIDISMGTSESKDQLLINFAEGILKLGLPFDKLLLETHGNKESAWVHVQAAKDPRNPEGYVSTCRDSGCKDSNNGAGIDLNFLRGR